MGRSCGENLTWTLDESTGELVIGGTGAMTDWSSHKSVPWYNYRLSIKSITIGNGVASIGDKAIYTCRNLASITIPDSVTSIGDMAIYECDSLESVTIGKGLKSIGDSVFYSCDSLESITVDSTNTVYSSDKYGVLFDKAKTVLIQYPIGNTRTSYTIPKGVTSIGISAFQYCGKLENIMISDGVTSINDNAFSYCSNLKSITIPNGVTDIGSRAFFQCAKLTSIMIPDSVTSVDDYALGFCSSLESVIFSDNITSINDAMFTYCSGLKSVTIPNGITSVGQKAFSYCVNLASVTIPASVTIIGEDAFVSSSNITDVYYSGSKEEWDAMLIGEGNEFLTKATIHFNYISEEPTTKPAETTTQPTTTFPSTTKPAETTTKPTTTVPSTTRPAETTTKPTTTVPSTTGPEATISGTCGENLIWTFDESTGELLISGTGDMLDFKPATYAPWYQYRSSIKSVTIFNGVTSVGDYAFDSYYDLKSITISDSVTSIGDSAFFNAMSLTSLTIGNGVTSIGDSAFRFCTKLTSLTIPDSVTSISRLAFEHCSSLKSVTIGNSVANIDYAAFAYCNEITDVYYIGTEEEWNTITFGTQNYRLTDATVHFNCAPGEPTTKPSVTVPSTTNPVTTVPSTTRSTTTGPATTRPTTTRADIPTTRPVTDNTATLQILHPSKTIINYGDSIILHVNVAGELPQGAKIVWTADNGNFAYTASTDGMTCMVSSSVNGDTTFTATVYDADGEKISEDEQTMTSKAGFFQKIIAFFKKLFGLTQTIPEAFRGIY